MNPILAQITRGSIVESAHRGAFVVANANGAIVADAGDIKRPIYPRSAVKAFQCLPVIESGAADHYGFTEEEIALCCSSHNGEPEHVRVAASMLDKCGATQSQYECGVQWPDRMDDRVALINAGEAPRDINNNCSGKHAGMIALARFMGVDPKGYATLEHPVQQTIRKSYGEMCGIDLAKADVGIDGCSVPTWAVPLRNVAQGFARLANHTAGLRIIDAARKHPFMIAGTGRFDTRIMEAVPRLFIKLGAEGVFCGTIAHAQVGFALKIDDGGIRGAEVAIAKALMSLDVWNDAEKTALETFTQSTLKNWTKKEVGFVSAPF